MLTTYFKHPFTLHKLRSGPASLYLNRIGNCIFESPEVPIAQG